MNNCPFLINLQSVKFIFTTLHFKNNEKFKKNGNSNYLFGQFKLGNPEMISEFIN